jgi:hypothetical protein
MRAKLTGAWTQRSNLPGCRIAGSALDRLLQDVIEVPLGDVARSPLGTERRPLIHFSQSRKQGAVQFLRTGSFDLGFNDELVALFPERAFCGKFVESLQDRPGRWARRFRLKTYS